MPSDQANQIERERWNNPFWSEHWPKRERFTERFSSRRRRDSALFPNHQSAVPTTPPHPPLADARGTFSRKGRRAHSVSAMILLSQTSSYC